jgi:hypothetical protein
MLLEDRPYLLANFFVDLEPGLGFTKIRSGHCRLAVTDGIADRTPNFLAS